MNRYDLVKKYISKFKNGIFVEIGTDRGDFAEFILENSDESNILLCIDPYTSYSDYEDSINFVTGDNLYNTTMNRLKKFGERVKFLRNFSEEAINYIPENIDFLYIDGNHKYDYVMKDLILYYNKLKNKGVCICDDAVDLDENKRDLEQNIFIEWMPGCSGKYGVVKAVNDFIKNKNCFSEIVDTQYLIIKN
jgi:hypothetical protein